MSTLAGEIDLMTGGRRMDQVLTACRSELSELATATGKSKTGGPWKRAEDEADSFRKTQEELVRKVAELSGALDERRRAEAERARLDEPEEREARDSALRIARANLQTAEAHAVKLEAADRDLKIASLEHEAAKAAEAELSGLAKALTDAEKAVSAAEKEEARAQKLQTKCIDEEETAVKAVRAAEDRTKTLRVSHAKAQRAMMARFAAERLGEMQSRLEKAEEQSKLLTSARAEVEANHVDEKTLATLEEFARQLTEAQARRDALAVTITPRYSGVGRIDLSGEELVGGEARTLLGRARLDLPGIGALEIDTGGRENADAARVACEAAERELRVHLENAGETTILEARAAHSTRQKAEISATRTADLLASLAPEGIDRLRDAVAALDLSAQAENNEESADPEAIAREIEQAESTEINARATFDTAHTALARAENALTSVRTELRLAAESVDEARNALGTETEQSQKVAQAADRLQQAKEALRKAQEAHKALSIAAPDMANLQAELTRTQGAVRVASERLLTLSEQIHRLDGLIRARAEDGIEEQLAEVEGQLETAEARASRYAREVAALQRLARSLDDARHAARDAYFEPVKAELLPLLSLLHSDADIRLDDTSLLPVALTRQGQEEEMDILSGGTAEQIAILTRLAFARLFARNGQSVPVILDDALIHSDDDRIESMFTALHRVAGDQQILVFTCRQRAFSRLGGTEAKPIVRKLRCAVYTRKSSEEGLEQEFNSLHAQREACEAYIASQRSEGWVLVRDQYDDGGISGGTLERPGLKRLLTDVEDGLVDVVVVYKIDRLSRSLMDFSKLVEIFDRNGVTFVSVTQSFNTTTSMGRLTLNILLSFAQFEREVTAERIRDKIAASRKKGMWMGGVPPYGYRVENRKLLVNEAEAAEVRWVFSRFLEIGSGTILARDICERGILTRAGNRMDKKFVYRLLNNRAYIGEAVHKGTSYPGEHHAIIDRKTWDRVHAILTESPRKRAARTRADTPALLKGLLYGPDGAAFSPTHTRKGGKLYRYYVSQSVLKHGAGSCPVARVPAGEIEIAVIDQLRAVFRQPEIVAGTWKAARAQGGEITETDARDALTQLDPLWDELFPAEQARIVALLIDRVDIGTDGLNVRLRIDGLTGLAREMMADLGAAA